MTEPVTNNVSPAAAPVPFEIDKQKDSKEVQALMMKTNEALASSKIEVAGNEMKPAVEGPKSIQVPQ
jgi:hypothetical protein